MRRPVEFLSCLFAGIFLILFIAGTSGAGEKTVRIGYAQWSCATAASNVVKAVLEEKMGYDCQLVPMDAEALWLSTASKDIDGFVCAWLPGLHQYFYAKAGDHVVDLGPNLEGTKVGLVVPEYVPLDSIEALGAHAGKFDNQIIGIDPGAGIMRFAKEAIKDYQIANMTLVPGSGAAMTKVLRQKIKNRQWVVVTGWTPHWKFARWDLKYLKDPKGVFGGSESIHTVVRKDLEKEKPDLYRFLDHFSWQPDDIHQVMDMIQKSGRPYQSAVRWIKQNPDKVESWLSGP
ncbi:glycine betaine/proline transport system substrate-binding protein [Desulfosalsimonas propionicica]|uniref:Glycine betaine/proline transport system substrate-binding protein n=1 Tax=Desulfosalsimonas propionicica TaxID=332175 RepID=A0A7W0C7I6_9BACT|nr:glycine betaine ABC transporter substrate-binding protein [Desulfosalsimonas propionicica]MBA2880552.1 glycine betaine/proline transport system substrate-binding protein [Desulfosalsimonas propionicica]